MNKAGSGLPREGSGGFRTIEKKKNKKTNIYRK